MCRTYYQSIKYYLLVRINDGGTDRAFTTHAELEVSTKFQLENPKGRDPL
jgi:hypothetical protein